MLAVRDFHVPTSCDIVKINAIFAMPIAQKHQQVFLVCSVPKFVVYYSCSGIRCKKFKYILHQKIAIGYILLGKKADKKFKNGSAVTAHLNKLSIPNNKICRTTF